MLKYLKKYKNITITAVVIILIIIFIAVRGCGNNVANIDDIYVKVVYPKIENVEQTVDVGGTVDAESSKSTFAGSSLKIEDVLFKVGDKAEKGEQVLKCVSVETDKSQSVFSIISPATGAISKIAEQGKVYDVNSNEPLITVMDLSKLVINSKVPETEIAGLKIGQDVRVTSEATDVKLNGKVTRISAIASNEASENDNSSVAYIDIEISFENKNNALRPNYNVDNSIITKEAKNALVLPKIAVITEDGKSYVYTLDAANIVHKKNVEKGIGSDYNVQVSGISKDVKVISNISSIIKDGAKLDPRYIIYEDKASSGKKLTSGKKVESGRNRKRK
jgi:multidrug efflux pump subunit AcrA (membrane-fusion protein)